MPSVDGLSMLLARHPQAFPFPVARSPRLSQPSPHLTCSSLRSIDPATSTLWIRLPRPLRSSASFPEGRGRSAIKQRARYPSTVGTPHVLAGVVRCPLPAAACCLLLAKKPFTYLPPFPSPSPPQRDHRASCPGPVETGIGAHLGLTPRGIATVQTGDFATGMTARGLKEGPQSTSVHAVRPYNTVRGPRRRVHYHQHPRVCCNSQKL
ncbi:hypothetical protein BKA56DRAFT_151735 [Ilyonectria sp. MPI-CAGE-AT-0026]|nr:hypothetical protein BKA56DRAFT_151735 [Ilyonectria sp. MPI-CAGE-AT-0026]